MKKLSAVLMCMVALLWAAPANAQFKWGLHFIFPHYKILHAIRNSEFYTIRRREAGIYYRKNRNFPEFCHGVGPGAGECTVDSEGKYSVSRSVIRSLRNPAAGTPVSGGRARQQRQYRRNAVFQLRGFMPPGIPGCFDLKAKELHSSSFRQDSARVSM